MSADAAGERRADAGELEIQLSVPNGCFGGIDGGLGAMLVCSALIDRLHAAEFRHLKLLGAPQLHLSQRFLGLRGLKLRDGLIAADLERSRVDLEQRVTLMDDLPVLEFDRRQRAAHLGAQLHRIDRGELAQKNGRAGDRILQRRTDRDARRRR